MSSLTGGGDLDDTVCKWATLQLGSGLDCRFRGDPGLNPPEPFKHLGGSLPSHWTFKLV